MSSVEQSSCYRTKKYRKRVQWLSGYCAVRNDACLEMKDIELYKNNMTKYNKSKIGKAEQKR